MGQPDNYGRCDPHSPDGLFDTAFPTVGASGMEESAAGLLCVCPYHPARSYPPVQFGHSQEAGDVSHVA